MTHHWKHAPWLFLHNWLHDDQWSFSSYEKPADSAIAWYYFVCNMRHNSFVPMSSLEQLYFHLLTQILLSLLLRYSKFQLRPFRSRPDKHLVLNIYNQACTVVSHYVQKFLKPHLSSASSHSVSTKAFPSSCSISYFSSRLRYVQLHVFQFFYSRHIQFFSSIDISAKILFENLYSFDALVFWSVHFFIFCSRSFSVFNFCVKELGNNCTLPDWL